MSTYPSLVASLTNPNATDRLNAPSHSSIHSAENDEITQTQTFVGTLSSIQGTLVYDIRSANSNGGGHIQSANKGGTGQTSYSKGDMLVATSTSVITKLAVGSVNGYVLTADSTQPAGVKWAPGAASTRIDVQYTNVSRAAGAASALTTYYAGSVLGSTLGTTNAIRYTISFPTFNTPGSGSIYGQVMYGNNIANSFVLPPASPSTVGIMHLEGYIAAASSVAAQVNVLKGAVYQPNLWGLSTNITQNAVVYNTGSSSVDSSALQTLQFQLLQSGASFTTSFLSGLVVVEKIA